MNKQQVGKAFEANGARNNCELLKKEAKNTAHCIFTP